MVHIYPGSVGKNLPVTGYHSGAAGKTYGIRFLQRLVDEAGRNRRIIGFRMIRGNPCQISLPVLCPVNIMQRGVQAKSEIQKFFSLRSAFFPFCGTVNKGFIIRKADKIFPGITDVIPHPGNSLHCSSKLQLPSVIADIILLRLYHHLQRHIPSVICLPHS